MYIYIYICIYVTNGNNGAVYYSCFIKFVEKAFIYLLENLYIYYIYIYIYIPNSTKLLLCHSLSWFINQRINTMLPVDRLKT